MKYSLRSLMIVVTLVCVAMGSFSVLRFRIVSRLRAVESIEALGGSVQYDNQDKPMDAPSDLAIDVGRALGDARAFSEVRCVTVYGKAGRNFGNSELSLLRHFPRLRLLHLDNTMVSDAGLGQLTAYEELEEIQLTGRPLSMAGVNELRPLLRHLKYIRIDAASDEQVKRTATELLPPGSELLFSP